jgi:hypothetical protein
MLRLKRLLIENAAAIERFSVDFPFTSDNLPKPVILVGENGSGKTTALSFVVDSLLQIAASEFGDVLTQAVSGTLFYRLRSHDVRIGASSSVTHVQFDFMGRNIDYIDRVDSTSVNINELRTKLGIDHSIAIDPAALSQKVLTSDIKDVALAVRNGAYVFFPSGRREVPHWLQEQALHSEHYTNKQRFNNYIDKPLIVETAAERTASWIMDGLLDKAAGYPDAEIMVANRILQLILEDPAAHFAVAPRNVWPRVQIYKAEPTGNPLQPFTRFLAIPSLGHLSAGQSMLLSMFSTIANQGALRQRRTLEEIDGIVIIDEIEVYLHTHLQRVVLPKLMKLFPKVQFLVSTHSPAFLMGMKDEFGDEGFEIRDMPSGASIDVDQFGEIGAAVEALSQSSAFKAEVRAEIAKENERPILIVEGRSDAIIIEGLWRAKGYAAPPFRVMIAKGRRALRYLLEDEEFIAQVGGQQRVLGLFDFDEAFDDWNGCGKHYPGKEGDESVGLIRKHTAKNIYAGLLPLPELRKMQAGERFAGNSNFTIELYLDDTFLNESQNLEKVIYPGDVAISKFRGDKVAFAEKVVQRHDLLGNFDMLFSMIKNVLRV